MIFQSISTTALRAVDCWNPEFALSIDARAKWLQFQAQITEGTLLFQPAVRLSIRICVMAILPSH